MPAAILLLLFFTALAFTPCSSNSQGAPTYRWKDDVTGESVTCEKCPPGTYVVKHCSKNRRTECGNCPDLHYTEFWNYVERCRYCNVFCTEEQYEKTPCSITRNRECACKSGYYLNYGFCSKHSACPPGEGVSINGTEHADVKCAPCEEGYFSSEYSSTKACQKHSECKAGERAIPGTEKQDTFCTTCKINSESASSPEDRAVCERAVIDFVSQHHLQPRKHKRLVNVARRMAAMSTENETLLDLFLSIQKSHSSKPFVSVMVEILQKARLPHLEGKVRRLFLDEC
ncbi:hypothetical protein MATL_G00103720 [Megalops atlanticus]|uniref:TNFR-Cys domain-containing protein n=1 Tax=Megalops atlanticus TaxID=7932 RepID=A0A9D3PZM8_MEGAT|nr:hypothetical protein MATL_G00103720 [Megalops atlanticus]